MILGFRRAPIIDRDTIDWEFETFEWLLSNFGGYGRFRSAELILPTDEFFPIEKGLTGHALAEAIFTQVKILAGLQDWPCTLVAQAAAPDPVVGDGHMLQGFEPQPAGTFSVSGNDDGTGSAVTITYDPGQLDDPMSLVATFAHELSHFLLATAPSLPPGDEDLLEFATDLTAVFLGFGVFMANSSFRFAQHGDAFSMGWSTRRQGYMTERQLTFALAIFANLLDVQPSQFTDHLKPTLRGLYKRAARTVLQDGERIALLKAVDPD